MDKELWKKKISEGRKKYLAENPDKHPWKRSDKFKSVPCNFVKEILKSKNIKFVDEWNPLEDRNFSIDIAFPDIKLGIEINGNQHYNSDGTLKDYYQKRHNIITDAGWTLIELHYSSCFNVEFLENILNFKQQPDYTEFFKIKEHKRNRNKNKIKIPNGQTIRIKNDIKWEPFKTAILNSNIDFSKYGWVRQVALILKISPQKVNKWMSRHMNDFYVEKCYKRKVKDNK